jgi:hypothetical protein
MPTDAMQKHNPNIERSDCVRLTLDCQFAEDFVLTINSWTAEGNTQHEKLNIPLSSSLWRSLPQQVALSVRVRSRSRVRRNCEVIWPLSAPG